MKTRSNSSINIIPQKELKRSKSVTNNKFISKPTGRKKKELIRTVEYKLLNNSHIQVENVLLYKASTNLKKNASLSYFYCQSRRWVNNDKSKICNFSGRVENFNEKKEKGQLDIIIGHNENCPKARTLDNKPPDISVDRDITYTDNHKYLSKIKQDVF